MLYLEKAMEQINIAMHWVDDIEMQIAETLQVIKLVKPHLEHARSAINEEYQQVYCQKTDNSTEPEQQEKDNVIPIKKEEL